MVAMDLGRQWNSAARVVILISMVQLTGEQEGGSAYAHPVGPYKSITTGVKIGHDSFFLQFSILLIWKKV